MRKRKSIPLTECFLGTGMARSLSSKANLKKFHYMRARVFHTMNEQLYYIMQWLKQAVPRKKQNMIFKSYKREFVMSHVSRGSERRKIPRTVYRYEGGKVSLKLLFVRCHKTSTTYDFGLL